MPPSSSAGWWGCCSRSCRTRTTACTSQHPNQEGTRHATTHTSAECGRRGALDPNVVRKLIWSFALDAACCRLSRSTPLHSSRHLRGDWFYRLTHHMSLGPYAWLSCVLQLVLLTGWYWQLKHHEAIQARVNRELERRHTMTSGGCMACIRNVLDGGVDEDEADTANEAGVPTSQSSRGGGRCVCGCSALFSTDCTLVLGNCIVLIGLAYLLLVGYGAVDSASRTDQTSACRSALPTGAYMVALNCAVVLLYLALLLARVVYGTTGREMASRVVALSNGLRQRAATRRGRRGASGTSGRSRSRYAQIGGNAAAIAEDADGFELGLELDDDDGDEDEHSLEVQTEGDLEDFLADGDPSSTTGSTPLAQPKPQRPAVGFQLSPPPPLTASSASGSGSAVDGSLALDEETRETLEMLEMGESMSTPASDDHAPTADQLAHRDFRTTR